jgi:hypothetical protein
MSSAAGEIQRLNAMTTQGLYEELGRSIIVTELGRPEAVSRLAAIERGQITFSRLREKLLEKVCGEWNYCGKRAQYGDFQALAYAIAPLVSSVVGVPAASAMVVTIILIKMGLDKLCNCPKSSL